MESRQTINERLIGWLEDRVRSRYAGCVSLVLLYGSYVNGTANELSDVDCCYVPAEEFPESAADGLSADFILAGVGYDFYPLSWERLEKIAELEGGLAPCLGDATVLCCRSDADLRRFEALQEKLKSNLADPETAHRAAAARFSHACGQFARMKTCSSLGEMRKSAGLLLMTLAEGCAYFHGDYFHFGVKKQYEDLCTRFPGLPDEIPAEYAAVALSHTAEELLGHAEKLLCAVGEHLSQPIVIPEITEPEEPAQNQPDYEGLAALYEEISSTFQKIYRCCGVSICGSETDPILAFLSACVLQDDLEYGMTIGAPACDLLGEWNPDDLAGFAAHGKAVEGRLVCAIEDGGAKIRKYATWEEFLAAGV